MRLIVVNQRKPGQYYGDKSIDAQRNFKWSPNRQAQFSSHLVFKL